MAGPFGSRSSDGELDVLHPTRSGDRDDARCVLLSLVGPPASHLRFQRHLDDRDAQVGLAEATVFHTGSLDGRRGNEDEGLGMEDGTGAA